MQKNWIGKSYGCEINFQIDKKNKFDKIKVFTTRPDTIFGASFIALSVDHPIAKNFEGSKDFLSFKSECSKMGTTEDLPIQFFLHQFNFFRPIFYVLKFV